MHEEKEGKKEKKNVLNQPTLRRSCPTHVFMYREKGTAPETPTVATTFDNVALDCNRDFAVSGPHATLGPHETLRKKHVATGDCPKGDDYAETTHQPGVDDTACHSLTQCVIHHEPAVNGDELLRG